MGAKFTKKTRTMFFDLEYQVPRDAQSSTYGSLLANPGRENQKILGNLYFISSQQFQALYQLYLYLYL